MDAQPDNTPLSLEAEASAAFQAEMDPALSPYPEQEGAAKKPCCCLNCAKRALMDPHQRCGSKEH